MGPVAGAVSGCFVASARPRATDPDTPRDVQTIASRLYYTGVHSERQGCTSAIYSEIQDACRPDRRSGPPEAPAYAVANPVGSGAAPPLRPGYSLRYEQASGCSGRPIGRTADRVRYVVARPAGRFPRPCRPARLPGCRRSGRRCRSVDPSGGGQSERVRRGHRRGRRRETCGVLLDVFGRPPRCRIPVSPRSSWKRMSLFVQSIERSSVRMLQCNRQLSVEHRSSTRGRPVMNLTSCRLFPPGSLRDP